ncbi:cache domain-containing sensor histidine kinase [Paenibacillus tarimensis]|uniref:cache domain-containing sensor histidine kinase n=1 Tax=Paenibacillus tarimensis TaxID=416012 RepID=UPI001F2AA65A|nr:sensor histidine kinase [Paenibacillus tarimensis]MCF2944690.1 sensor histidine kinase [Paenibacillus tarimensis]
MTVITQHRRMRRLLSKLLLRDRPLMTKLMVFSAFLVAIPMLCAGLITYRHSSITLEREAKQYSWQVIEQVKHYVEDYFRDFEINSLRIVNHPETAAFIRSQAREAEPDEELTQRVRNVLKNSAYTRSDVANMTLLVHNGMNRIDSNDQPGVSSVLELPGEYWYGSVSPAGKPKVYSRLVEWKGRVEPVISVVKGIANPRDLSPFGMLVIDLNYKRLQDVARKVRLGQSGSGYLFILDERDHYIYHPDYARIGTRAEQAILQAAGQQLSGSAVTAADTEGSPRQLLTFSTSEALGWRMFTSIPYTDLMASRSYIGRTIVITSAAFILLAYVLSFGFAASLVRPVRRLYQFMKRVEIGDLKGSVEVESKDEIGKLSAGFNKMVSRLHELLEEVYFSKLRETEMSLRQKDTELKMLQAQINPHFLYNALETIRGMALEHDRDDIASMSASLSRLLRYNVKDDSPVVTLRQELEVAEVYLKIQSFRFEDRLSYDLSIPQQALEFPVPKFTLQPLIENSIVHGLEPEAGGIRISITAELLREDAYILTVSDTGAGMAPEQVTQFMKADEQPRGHIGIRNVQLRIRHLFGEPYGLDVASQRGIGTEIKLVLPCKHDRRVI